MTFIRSAWSSKFIRYPFPFLLLAKERYLGWRPYMCTDVQRLLLNSSQRSSNPTQHHGTKSKENNSTRNATEVWAHPSEASHSAGLGQESRILGRGGRNQNYDTSQWGQDHALSLLMFGWVYSEGKRCWLVMLVWNYNKWHCETDHF